METIKRQDPIDRAPNLDSGDSEFNRACGLRIDTLTLNNVEPSIAWEALAAVLTGGYTEAHGDVEYFLQSVNAYMRSVISARDP